MAITREFYINQNGSTTSASLLLEECFFFVSVQMCNYLVSNSAYIVSYLRWLTVDKICKALYHDCTLFNGYNGLQDFSAVLE